MIEFFDALRDPDVPFLRYALFVGLLASIPFGVTGTLVVSRRITYIAGAIAHAALGGIGAALYFQHQLGWAEGDVIPLIGAVVQALLAAIIIGAVSLYGKEREDTVIGAVWAIGMAQGLLFMAKTPGYLDPMSYLFGRIILISQADLWVVGMLTLLVLGLVGVFYHRLVAVCFDEEFARVRGIKVEFYYFMLLCLTALTVVLLVRVVGIVMVIALLTLPAAAAGQFARRIWQMMALSVLFCMLFTSSGLAVGYVYDLPVGPTIICIGGLVYLFTLVIARRN